ncbi:MAG TPA: nucleotidyltransferase domain-containing protein [bacterium]|nr:nucleotidyltransferase domain-containing protein [bacterium]
MNKARMDIPQAEIAAFCGKWKIAELALFGSVLREDFREDSDVGVLVSFAPDSRWSLMDLVRMEEELGVILGRKVDLVERKSVEISENYIRCRHVLSSLDSVYP